MQIYAYLYGAVAIAGSALLYAIVAHLSNLAKFRFDLWKLIDGQDGRLSTSKFQLMVWFVVVLFGYVTMYAALAMQGDFIGFDEVPQNVLIALGLASGTSVVAKSITTSQVTGARVAKSTGRKRDISDLVKDDGGWPDLFKVQMLTWTFIASAAFLAFVAHDVNAIAHASGRPPGFTLPDIDGALMILMGLGQGSYLGKKLVSTDPPTLQSLAPPTPAAGVAATMFGVNLGVSVPANKLLVDGAVVPVTNWTESTIEFVFPAAALPAPAQHSISAVVNGRTTNTLTA